MDLKQFARYCDLYEIYGDMIVLLEYWYNNDKRHSMSYEVCHYTGSEMIWFNDWDEGQQNSLVRGYIMMDNLDITNHKDYVKLGG